MRFAVAFTAGLALLTTRVGAQSDARSAFTPGTFRIGGMAVGAATHASPAIFGEDRTEGYLTQPNIMADAVRGWFAAHGTLNFEGYTLRRGELNAGIYGEGFVDRRHPHTLVHELMFTATTPQRHRLRASLAAGKGFVSYGTDDPMMRPFVKYPVNHHHAQIIERIVTTGALRIGSNALGAALEHSFFNGDEPVSPFTGPQWNRFGDSRSTRLTLIPVRDVEVQASRAFVHSPGITQGGAFDHTQTSVSVRTRREREYALVEFARTDEGFTGARAFRFNSMLSEVSASRRNWSVAVRAERTERPENERLLDPFRIANGHIDFQIVGITRWDVATVHVAAPPVTLFSHQLESRRVRLVPFAEVALAQPREVRKPAVFVPREFYGASSLWSVTAGLRLHVGTMRSRMGRYGVLSDAGTHATVHPSNHHENHE